MLQSGVQNSAYYERLWETIVDGKTWKEEITNRRKDGSSYQAFQIISPIRNRSGDVRSFVAIQHDITREKEIESQLRHSLAEQNAVFENTQDALFLVDVVDEEEFRYVKLNPTHERITGLTTAAVRGKRPQDLLDEKTAEGIVQHYQECVAKRRPISYEETLELPKGRKVWSTMLSPIELDGKIIQLVGSAREITEQKELEARLRYLSGADPLTGIANRRKSMEELDREVERSLRYDHPFSLLMIDLDHFKSINDRFGHSVGDSVLTRFAQKVKSLLRPTDTFGRWGGEEFIILLSETDRRGALILAERIRRTIHESSLIQEAPVTASIGVASLQGGQRSRDELINAADRALYQAKEDGRNRVFAEA
jgi:diguanylate cyclase (GGDEF)-like protein/PAS domain S-box-containing protein